MPTTASTIAYILDQLTGVPQLAAKKMFGEYTLYTDGKVVALVCNDTLFVKMTDTGKTFVGEAYEEGAAYPGAKPSLKINEDLLEDREWLTRLIMLTAEHLPTPKSKKK